MADPVVEEIRVHPVKGTRPVRLDRCRVDRFGPHLDRRWMVVDTAGRFLSGRRSPALTRIVPRLEGEGLILSAAGVRDVTVPAVPEGGPVSVQIWSDRVQAVGVGEEVDRWLEGVLGDPVRLVFLPDDVIRPVDPGHAPHEARVSFADGFPFLLVGRASLDELNRRLARPLSMDRFRPNLVVAGSAPHAEDRWRRIQVGSVALRIVKPCARCVVTTLDPATGEAGREPLRTLATYRRSGSSVYFGQNAVHSAPGRIAVGDPVRILDEGEPRPGTPLAETNGGADK